MKIRILTCVMALLLSMPLTGHTQKEISPDEARSIAKEAYIYVSPMVDGYRIQHVYFVNKQSPEYKAPFNQIYNISRVYTPQDKAVQSPNSDTPYSVVGMDLREEPIVLTVPKIEKDRYFSNAPLLA